MISMTTIEERRGLFRASPTKALLLDGLIPEKLAAALRDQVTPRLVAYDLADRGRYHFDETFAEPELFFGLTALATQIAELRLRSGRARWTRFRRGDYALYKNDSRLWRGMDQHFEFTLDFSAAGSEEGQVVWATPADLFWMPQRPLSGALVDRRQPIQRYDRYLTHRAGDAEVFRLSLALEVF